MCASRTKLDAAKLFSDFRTGLVQFVSHIRPKRLSAYTRRKSPPPPPPRIHINQMRMGEMQSIDKLLHIVGHARHGVTFPYHLNESAHPVCCELGNVAGYMSLNANIASTFCFICGHNGDGTGCFAAGPISNYHPRGKQKSLRSRYNAGTRTRISLHKSASIKRTSRQRPCNGAKRGEQSARPLRFDSTRLAAMRTELSAFEMLEMRTYCRTAFAREKWISAAFA